uniref:Dehydration-responsive element-binding protein 5-10 n=1 Tax=Syntrichia caninervis TaxID=200751 RepID=A0A144LHG7_9BRYO|nr:dehydration-responsive element-binding protein 5-10 [Syntrichia caninervis]
MAGEEAPSTLCRIWSAITPLMRFKNKIREHLWASSLLNDPDLHRETETASTLPEQHYYDASSQAFEAASPPAVTASFYDNPGDLATQLQAMQRNAHAEPEVYMSLDDFPVELISQPISADSYHRSTSEPISEDSYDRSISEPISEDSYDRSMSQPISEDSYLRSMSQPIEEDFTSDGADDDQSSEMMDTGAESSDLRRESSAEEWQQIMFFRHFFGMDSTVPPVPGWTVVVGIVSVFKRITGLIRQRRQERAQNQVAVVPRPRRRRAVVVTRYKGIRPRNGKWVSEIRIGGTKEKVWLGSYNTEKEAALAFDAGKHHCSLLRRTRGFNFNDSPRFLGPPQRFEHLTSEKRKENIKRLAEEHALTYASADIR